MNHKLLQVLLIEDNPGDAHLIREMLGQDNRVDLHLESVDRLSEGLERLSLGGVDVLLLDLSLPDSHGLDTVVKAQACAPQIPIVVLTGLDDEKTAIQSLQEGAQDYLVKGELNSGLLVRSVRYAIERKSVLQALQESEERFRTLVEQAGDAMALIQPNGRFVDVNQRACDALGYTRDELLALSVPDVDLIFSREKFEVHFQGLDMGKPVTIESVHRRRDGTTFPVEIRTGLIEMQGKPHILALARDITGRKEAEEELRRHRDQLEDLVKERTKEIEEKVEDLKEYNKLFIDREFRIKELRDRVEELEGKGGH